MKVFKKNFTYIVCASLGLWNYIMLAFNYFAFYRVKFSGYDVLDLRNAGFAGTMSVVMQVFIVLFGLTMLAWGTIGFLKGLGVFKKFPEKLAKLFDKKIGELGMLIMAGLNVLLMVFLIIFVLDNDFKLRAGGFFAIAIPVAAFVVTKILGKKFEQTAEEEPASADEEIVLVEQASDEQKTEE